MRDHRPSIRFRAALVLVVPIVLAFDAVGPRSASAIASPARRGIGHRPFAPPTPSSRRARAPAPRRTSPPASSSLARVERHLDSSGWGWREAGVKLRLGFYPGACCHMGTYHFPSRTMWIGPSAFRSERRLRYVALHELAHGWQSTSTHMRTARADMQRWGRSGMSGIEAHADCLAAHWGAGRGHYWDCPTDARALAAFRLAEDR